MAGLQQEFNEQETKQLISDAVAKGNSFRVRVMRRRPGGGLDVVASFEEGTAEQIAFAEKWLPELAGGGNFLVQAFHETEPMKQLGGSISLSIDNTPPRNVDFDVVNSATWTGPRGLSYPKRQRPGANGGMHADGGGAEAMGFQRPIGTTPIQQPLITSSDPHVAAMERAQRAEEALREERMRGQIAAIQQSASQTVKTLETQVQTLVAELREERARAVQAFASAQPKTDVMEALGKLGAVLVPIVQTMISSNNDVKLKMMEMDGKNAERAMMVAKEQSEQLNRILTTMLDKKGVDPTVQLMIEQLKEMGKRDDANPILKDVITSFSAMAQSTLQVMTAATDAGLIGNRDGGGVAEVVSEVARAASAGFEAYVASKNGQQPAGAQQVTMQPQPQPRLPPPQPKRLTPFQRLDQLIKVHHNVTELANFFLDGVQRDPEIRQRFAQAGNDIEAFFKTYWAQWAMTAIEQHGPYVMALNEAVLKAAQSRGMLGRPAPAAPQAAAQPPAPQAVPATPAQAVAAVDPADGGGGGEGDLEDDEPIDEEEDEVHQ